MISFTREEKEMLDNLHAMDLLCPYLLGQLFQIKTDHESQVLYGTTDLIPKEKQNGWPSCLDMIMR